MPSDSEPSLAVVDWILMQDGLLHEVHVGFAAGFEMSFEALRCSDRDWSPLTFESIVRPDDASRFDAHDVPGGVRDLLTIRTPTLETAFGAARTARDIVGPLPEVRVEIEQILSEDEDFFTQRPSAFSRQGHDGLYEISDFPPFESHLNLKPNFGVMTSTDVEAANQVVKEFNELAITAGGEKAIYTIFFDNIDEMQTKTLELRRSLLASLPDRIRVKAVTERIVFCASFGEAR